MDRVGCIHGRFQPFHNGHFEYMLAALTRCDHLVIGITQYGAGIDDTGSPAHRMDDADNPFSYWERVQIIRSILTANQVDLARCEIVPFPIHDPIQINNFVPPDCTMYTTIYESWNREKIARLTDQGYKVEILWEREHKAFEGKRVREALRKNDNAVGSMLPPGAYSLIAKLLQNRGL